jgi:hemoglobin
MADQTNGSLYQRLGGYDVIAAIIDGLYARMRSEPALQRFSMGRSEDSRNRARQLFVDQMCALSGGPCVYIGRDMKTSHAGLGITQSEWDLTMRLTAASLETLKIPPSEKEEFLAIFRRFREEIVEETER